MKIKGISTSTRPIAVNCKRDNSDEISKSVDFTIKGDE